MGTWPYNCTFPKAVGRLETAHALEVTYAGNGHLGVGILIQFNNAADAKAFFTARSHTLSSCDSIIENSVRNDAGTIVDSQSQIGWSEAMRYSGEFVLLMATDDITLSTVPAVQSWKPPV